MSSEKSIVEAIRRYLKSVGAKVHKTHGGFGSSGTPDLLGSLWGRALAFEVKKPGGRLTALQVKELAEWDQAGAISGKVESVEEVKNLLKGEIHGER